MSAKVLLQYFTTFIVLIPIVTGIIKIKPTSHVEKSVLFFLLIGFAVDVIGMYFESTRKVVVIIYALLEITFFMLLLRHFFKTKFLKQLAIVLALLFAMVWTLSFVVFVDIEKFFGAIRKLYDMFYCIVVSVLSGYLVLKMIEEEDAIERSSFWILLAVFISTFCSFFVSAFIREEVGQKIWYLHNLVSILTCFIFTKAFLSIKKAT
jgi:hypothetical protein